MIQKKIFILILIESVLIVLLACGIYFVARHYKDYDNNKNSKAPKTEKEKNNHNKEESNITNNTIPSVPVEVTKVTKKEMNIFLEANCNIEAEKEIDILSKTSGEVMQIVVEEGGAVISGDLLVQLDKKEASLALKEAQVKLENTKQLFDRSKKTLSDKIMSIEEFEGYKLNYQMANVEYEKKKMELDYFTIKAPIQGTVVERLIEVGDNVQQGETLFRLAKFDRIYGKVYVPEKDFGKVEQGQTAYISVESIPDIQFKGKVQLINPVIDAKSGTIKVTVEIIDDKITMLRPGMFATIHIIIDKHQDAIVIPKKSLVMDSIIDEVFVVRDKVAYKVQIELGFSEGDEVEALSGLTENDFVIVAGHEDLIQGSKVFVVSE